MLRLAVLFILHMLANTWRLLREDTAWLTLGSPFSVIQETLSFDWTVLLGLGRNLACLSAIWANQQMGTRFWA